MKSPLEILIFEKVNADRPPQLVATLPLRGRTELGRQKTVEESLYAASWQEAGQCQRIVVARGTEQTIGRMHLLIDVLPEGRLQLTNTSSRSTVQIENGPSITRGVPFRSEVPPGGLVLRLGASRSIRLQARSETPCDIGELPQATLPPEEFTSRLGHSLSARLPITDP